MEFLISRTSQWSCKEPPCEDAYLKEYVIYNIRTCTEAEFNKKFGESQGLWRSKGKNHCIPEPGHIKREDNKKGKFWTISIDDLCGLIEFKNRINQDIIISEDSTTCMQEIEIYDNYRE